jgi:4-azaleucine resistance transporter AzlC
MIKEALRDSKPTAFGYLLLGAAFGLLFQSLNLHWIFGILMSTMVYAGFSQFIAIPILAAQGSLFSIAIATFLVNLRHIFYGIVFLDKFKYNKILKSYLIFGLTDECFSIISAKNKFTNKKYEATIVVLCHVYWIIGTFIGIFLHKELVGININFLFFSLVALFAILTVDSFKVNKDIYSLSTGILTYIFFKFIGVKEVLFFSMLMSFFIIYFKVYINQSNEDKNVIG